MIDHIAKYLEIRYDFEGEPSDGEANGGGQSNGTVKTESTPPGANNNSSTSNNNNCDNSSSTTSSSATITNVPNNNNATNNANSSSNNSDDEKRPFTPNGNNLRKSPYPFTIYIAGGPGQFNPVPGGLNLQQVHEKFWRANKPLELYYAYKMEPTTPNDQTGFVGKNGTPHKTW